ncbi:hypothetical protein CV770_26645 [Bradyrhizobium sp. AC87j1]|uniref:hypothetical protein n=1 Tax=Bradyrhizobium sp. AC87j1 TaxID=2055894 RepID=UPI000D4C7E3C|nr:hypothetical protein [Bradyrhizobium sp. AC87j1]PPQ16328.1 hypothetical protein CV770_26645 [Bradyrhizobium sp. AC87j1]
MTDQVSWKGPPLPAIPLNLTLAEAAGRQVDAAIDALQRGDFDIALTLAGAAEGMIKRDGPHMFAWLRDNQKAAELFPDKRQWINTLNRELYWLKHGGEETMEIDCATAVFMIARAMTKLDAWTPKMDAFKPWLLDNLDNV